jgi:hypothetical protein
MPTVEIHPDAQKRSYLRGGQYGPGMTHPADCEVTEYQFPADEAPRWDKAGKAEDYAFLRIRVNSEEFGSVTIFHHEPIKEFSGSKLGEWLVSLGVPVEGETLRHDTDQVPGRKCGVEVSDPREWEGRWFTGKLINVMGS